VIFYWAKTRSPMRETDIQSWLKSIRKPLARLFLWAGRVRYAWRPAATRTEFESPLPPLASPQEYTARFRRFAQQNMIFGAKGENGPMKNHRKIPEEAVKPESGASRKKICRKWPKSGFSRENVCSSRLFCMDAASGIERFLLLNPVEDFLGPPPHHRRVHQPEDRTVLRAGQLSR